MDTMHNKVTVSFRVEPELRERLERAAAADRRPVGSLIRNVLADFVARQAGAEQRAA
jgi:predicted transcriptional regulator